MVLIHLLVTLPPQVKMRLHVSINTFEPYLFIVSITAAGSMSLYLPYIQPSCRFLKLQASIFPLVLHHERL